MLAAAEPIEKAARLRPGPLLPVVLILLIPELGLRCHAGRLGYRQNNRQYNPTHFSKHSMVRIAFDFGHSWSPSRQTGEVPGVELIRLVIILRKKRQEPFVIWPDHHA
jgi:hypothetical protein